MFRAEFRVFGLEVLTGLDVTGGWFHYHVLAPSLEWFASIDSALNAVLDLSHGLVTSSLSTGKLSDRVLRPLEAYSPLLRACSRTMLRF